MSVLSSNGRKNIVKQVFDDDKFFLRHIEEIFLLSKYLTKTKLILYNILYNNAQSLSSCSLPRPSTLAKYSEFASLIKF